MRLFNRPLLRLSVLSRPQEKPKPTPAPAPVPVAPALAPTPPVAKEITPTPSPVPAAAEPVAEPTPEPTETTAEPAFASTPIDNQAPSSEDEAVTSAPHHTTHGGWDLPSSTPASAPAVEQSQASPVTEESQPEQLSYEQKPQEKVEPEPEPQPTEQQTQETAAPLQEFTQQTPSSSAPPPGFESVTTPNKQQESPAARPSTIGRNSASRFKQVGDQAVIMPGGAQSFDRVGMQFGSLSLGGDDQFNGEAEQPAYV